MSEERKPAFLNTTDFDEGSIDPEILPAVKALRDSGIETIASCAGVGQINVLHAWGSYIQFWLWSDIETITDKVNKFALSATERLRQDLRTQEIALQLISAEEWYKDRNTTILESRVPVYRLQLVGQTNDEEILYAWRFVAENFTSLNLQP